MKGVLAYTDQKVVSTDFRGESCTSIFDAEAGDSKQQDATSAVKAATTGWRMRSSLDVAGLHNDCQL